MFVKRISSPIWSVHFGLIVIDHMLTLIDEPMRIVNLQYPYVLIP